MESHQRISMYELRPAVRRAIEQIGIRKRQPSRKRRRDRNNAAMANVTAASVFAGDDRRNLDILTARQFEAICSEMRSNIERQKRREKRAYALLCQLCPPHLRLGLIMPSSNNLDMLQRSIIRSCSEGGTERSGRESGTGTGASAEAVQASERQREELIRLMVHQDPLQFGNVLFLEKSDFPKDFEELGAPYPRSPWLVNFAIVFTLGVTEINLEGVRAIPGLRCHYSNRGFPALTIWIRLESGNTHQCVTMRIHSSGRVVLTGARTEGQALSGSYYLVRLLQMNGFPVSMCDFAIQNLVLTMDVGFEIDLDRLSREQNNHVRYKKKRFPLAEYRLGTCNVDATGKPVAHVALMSGSGKLVIAGTNSDAEARRRSVQTYIIAYTYRKDASIQAPEPSTSDAVVGFMSAHDLYAAISVLSTGMDEVESGRTRRGRPAAIQWNDTGTASGVRTIEQPPDDTTSDELHEISDRNMSSFGFLANMLKSGGMDASGGSSRAQLIGGDNSVSEMDNFVMDVQDGHYTSDTGDFISMCEEVY